LRCIARMRILGRSFIRYVAMPISRVFLQE
jgi:hypothetical protein